MTPMEKTIITELIEDWAAMIGLPLEETDVDDILEIYENKKRETNDIQSILLGALYSLQEERAFVLERNQRVGKSSLVLVKN